MPEKVLGSEGILKHFHYGIVTIWLGCKIRDQVVLGWIAVDVMFPIVHIHTFSSLS